MGGAGSGRPKGAKSKKLKDLDSPSLQLTEENINIVAKNLSNLPQYKETDIEELKNRAEEVILRRQDRVKERVESHVTLSNGIIIECDTKDCADFIQKTKDSYEENVDFSSHQDDLFNLLILQKQFFDLSKSKKTDKRDELLAKCNSEIRNMKEKLGITRAQTVGADGETQYDLWMELQKRVLEEKKKSPNCFRWICGFCGSINLNELPHFAFINCTKDPETRDCIDCMDKSVPAQYAHLPLEKRLKHRTNTCGKEIWSQEVAELVRDKILTVIQAAKILQISAIGFLMIAKDRDFDLGFEYDLNKPDTIEAYVE